jgi:hypothetical protein
MANIFTTQFYSNEDELYKVDLFADDYTVISWDIIGGSGQWYYISGDWTGYLFLNVDVITIDDDVPTQSNRTILESVYNEAENRTEIRFTVGSYDSARDRIIYNESPSYLTFSPDIISIHTDWENEGDILLQSIKASSTTITYSNNDDYFDWFLNLYLEASDLDLKLVIYKDNSGWELEWVGNIVIDLLEWDNISKPRPITFKAIDGLDMLKDVPYSEVTTSPTQRPINEHISRILEKNDLSQFWGTLDPYLRESIEYRSNEVSGTLTDSHSPLDYSSITDTCFITSEDNSVRGISCYDALKGLMELFNCRIFISKGVYYVQQIRNYEKLSVIVYREYTKSLNSYSRGQYSHKLTAGRNGTEDLRLHGGGKFGYLAGLLAVEIPASQNRQVQYDFGLQFVGYANNPNVLTQTIDVYGGTGTGNYLTLTLRPRNIQKPGFAYAGSYLYVKVEISGTDSGTTYYLSGGMGAKTEWVTIPYAKLHYDLEVKGLQLGTARDYTIVTPEIPFSGQMDVTITFTHVTAAGNTISISAAAGNTWSIVNLALTAPVGNENTVLLSTENPNSNYTKVLKLDPLIITDSSNSTSVNVVSVAEDYLTTNNTLVKSETWDAGFDTDQNLAFTRVMEGMSLQLRPIELYRGKFVGQYYPHNTIVYNNKTYFFNGFRKNYDMDEVDGEWVEQSNQRTGIAIVDNEGWTDTDDRTGDGDTSGLVAFINNTNVLTSLESDLNAGTITSLTIGAIGSTKIYEDDVIQLLDPITKGVVEEFEVSSDVASSDTTISVTSKSTSIDIPQGTYIMLKPKDYIDVTKIRADKVHFKSTATPPDASALNDGEMVIDAGNIYVKVGSTIYVYANTSTL